MGTRTHMAIGFGIQLSKEQLKAFNPDDAEEKVFNYLKEKMKTDVDYQVLMSAKMGGSMDNAIRDSFTVPRKEYGTKTFLGYLTRSRYGDIIDHEVAIHLCNGKSENFEIQIPINITVKEIKTDRNEPYFVPSVGSAIWADAKKMHEKATGRKTFQSADECKNATLRAAKENVWLDAVWYERGLDVSRVVFPEVTMDDIEKYILGWWA